jgi:hypothetical protein
LYGHPYSGNEFHFGIGNDNWIHEIALSKDLQMHFGKKIQIEDFRDESLTTYDQVFDFIEVYYERSKKDLDYNKRMRLFTDIFNAFENSGSVYEFNSDGQVILKIDNETAKTITKIDSLLDPIEDAQKKFRELIDGLITRSKDPADAVGDMYMVFEDYCKLITKESNPDNAVKIIEKKLHPTQSKLIENLKAYRGDVWGSAHAGKGKKPTEVEAIWYIKTLLSYIEYINAIFS